tara:strand:- start:900 stop:1085 length:186 start_codon:yes stop_codon:yes gene_type:complete
MKTTVETLNKKFDSLNKEYVKLDKSLNTTITEDAQILISQKLEDIQQKMSVISNQIEELED